MNFFRIRGGAAVLAVGLTLTALFGSGPFCSTGHAQVIIGGAAGGPPSGVIYPSQQYYVALGLYREGRLPDAIDGFRGAIRSARTDAAGKWVDAIPSLAMLGECYYQNGDLGLALDQFDQALQITLRYDGWIGALQWPGTLAPVASEWRPSWMSRNRNLTAGQLPRNVLLATGVLDQTQVIQNGGVVNVPTLNRIDGVEVLRGLAIVLYRRAQILGPLAVGEQLNERLLVAFATGRSATEGWAKPLVGTLQGLTMLQDGQYDAAQVLLKDSMQLVGSLEHSLSPIARTALANILLRSGNAGNAANALPLYNDASVSAALWQQPEWIVEPLTRAVGPALASGQVDEIYNAASGANTTMNRDFRTFGAHCSLIAGEIAANGNKADEAFRRLTDTAPVLASGRKPAGSSRTQAYAQYVRAVTSAVQGNVADANQAIGLATTFAKGTPQAIASPRLFQLSRIGLAARTANLGDLTTENRLLELLNLEAPGPWINDPVEALAVQTSDLTNFSSLMVDIARRRNKNELVVQRLDDWQRQSFRQSLPWGGRLSDLRWLVASSEDWLPPDAATARQNLPAVFQPLQNQLRELSLVTGQLSVMPPADVKNQAARREMITRVERGGDLAEAMILRLGLMRASVPALFPPRLADPQWYNRIPSDGAILGFANISDRLVGVWATSKELRIWNVTSRNVGTLTMNLLQAIQTPRDATGRPVDQALLAANLAQVLLPDGWTLPANVRRLVIVPAGPLWQVPFELLPSAGPDSRPLGEATVCSYAPTYGLAIHPVPVPDPALFNGFVNNHLLSPDPQLDNELVQQFQKDLPQAMMLTADQVGSGRTASGLLRTICILASDAIDPTALGKWGPLVYDRTLPGGTLNDWMRFPWSAPQCVLLPGTNFTQARDGAEAIFHVACGLHASGVPAAVVTRWPMGGASTAQVMKETMLEAPDLGVTLAWHRARALLWQSELRRDQELVPQEDTDETSCSGKEARFWASYLLLDGFRE